mgnify:CR=1 FL=1
MGKFDYSGLLACGENTYISHQTEIKRPHLSKIGRNVAIDSYTYCTTGLDIGDHTHISPHVSIIGGERALFKTGIFCNLAAGTRIICISDAFLGDGLIGAFIPEEYKDIEVSGNVTLNNFCNVGTNAVIFPGVELKEGTVIGAGSVVRNSTEPWTIYAGNPAKPIKKRNSTKMTKFAGELGY